MPAIQILTYASVVIGIVAMIAKAYRYLSAPEHFRWELYPVPHEKGRAEYGGSYLEELDWWSKPRHSDLIKEGKEMAEEILLLKGVFKHNRKVWVFSLPFHLGMYIGIGWMVFLLVGAILHASGMAIGSEAGGVGIIIHFITIVAGYIAFILTGVGALGLFIWRLGNSGQRTYNAPIDYFNLLFFDIIVAVALIGHLTSDPSFIGLREYTASLITFSPATVSGIWLTIEIILGSLLLLYIPLTRMSHFVAKYFLYHSVRWNDEPNKRGSKIEKRIYELLNQQVGWQAPHIQTGQPWKDVVREMSDE